jgi:hypothetical protein
MRARRERHGISIPVGSVLTCCRHNMMRNAAPIDSDGAFSPVSAKAMTTAIEFQTDKTHIQLLLSLIQWHALALAVVRLEGNAHPRHADYCHFSSFSCERAVDPIPALRACTMPALKDATSLSLWSMRSHNRCTTAHASSERIDSRGKRWRRYGGAADRRHATADIVAAPHWHHVGQQCECVAIL